MTLLVRPRVKIPSFLAFVLESAFSMFTGTLARACARIFVCVAVKPGLKVPYLVKGKLYPPHCRHA